MLKVIIIINTVWIYKGCNVLINGVKLGLKASDENETKEYIINIDSWSKVGNGLLMRSPIAKAYIWNQLAHIRAEMSKLYK